MRLTPPMRPPKLGAQMANTWARFKRRDSVSSVFQSEISEITSSDITHTEWAS